MPRAPRVFEDGGIYHVYNRVTRGERVFNQDEEALELVGILREVRDRDRLRGECQAQRRRDNVKGGRGSP